MVRVVLVMVVVRCLQVTVGREEFESGCVVFH